MGLEFWFTPPASAHGPAKAYKQFLLTLSAIYPLSMIVPWALQPVFRALPIPGQSVSGKLLIAAAIVGLMTYVIMPRYTRLAAKWLFDRDR
jgi:antibiotic biosynthesis monooxygenase (ABM) superfamily enzyme